MDSKRISYHILPQRVVHLCAFSTIPFFPWVRAIHW